MVVGRCLVWFMAAHSSEHQIYCFLKQVRMKVCRKYKICIVYLFFHNHYKWQNYLWENSPYLCQRQMPGNICRWITAWTEHFSELCVHVEQAECWKHTLHSRVVALQVRVRAHSKMFPLHLHCSVILALTPGWKWEIGSVNNRLTLPWRYFLLMGKMLFFCWLCFTSPPSKEGTRVVMFSNSAVFPGTQFHQHTRVNSKCWFYAQSSHRSFQMVLPHILVTCSPSLHSPSCNTGHICAVSLTLSLISVHHAFTNSLLVVVLYLPLIPLYFWQPKRQHMLCGVQSSTGAALCASELMLFAQWSRASCSAGGLSYPFLSSSVALPQPSLPVTCIFWSL